MTSNFRPLPTKLLPLLSLMALLAPACAVRAEPNPPPEAPPLGGAGLQAASPGPAAPGAGEFTIHTFDRQKLSDVFTCEGASYGDVSGDKVNDLIAGPYWYQGPDFKEKHEYYAPKPFDPKGYSDNFFVHILDLDGDGWKDIFIIGFPGQDASWYKNPQGKPGHWTRHIVFDTVDNESPAFADITGDGKPELVFHTGGRFGYASPDWAHADVKWAFTPVSEKRELGKFTHGLGIGDVNGDGRIDILEKGGWYEQPASLAGAPVWVYHAFPFAPGVGGSQMYAYDFDGDGDNDVLTSLNAHGFGLVWHEQVRDGGSIAFKTHPILGAEAKDNEFGLAFGQMHAIDLVDMDGDGLKDIVTGVRVWAHYGDPSAEPPGVLYWFKTARQAGGGVSFLPYQIDGNSGIGVQVVAGDVDGDGDPDVVVGNKTGTYFLRHQKKAATRAQWLKAQPRKAGAGGLTPAEAAERMEAPDGFQVRLVAGEPDVHQPVAIAIDERGRLWIAEAYTYPNRVGGREGKWNEGLDKIIIFEDADHDGSFETRKTFAENINLVSGLEVGFGGVWVGAAPYLLFFPDRDRDDRPDGPPEVLLDGWGIQDTHETLNAFIWGPDGWLYGCHGVFTHSRVGKPGAPDAERTPMNAGVWRYHPTRHQFEVFAWGTSNPWGVDFNDHGQAFITACVIPHLYHMIQGANYQRQGGQHFSPYVYDDIKTIADHAHYAGNIQDHAWWGQEPVTPQGTLEAGGGHAHCGAMIYLGNNFPPRYRDTLFMNNIHGNRINNDILEARGSGFVGHHSKDFVLSNDRWFRGINMKYGPDGSVYFIDWYDKNACHRTQPEIWDRSSGRIYRVAYGDPKALAVDVSSQSDEELVKLQLHANDWFVRQARRQLQERAAKGSSPKTQEMLLAILRAHIDDTRRLRALWALHVTGGLSEQAALEQLERGTDHLRAWTIQLLAEGKEISARGLEKLADLGRRDPSPVVRLYLASALQRLPAGKRWDIAAGLLAHGEDAGDHNLPLLYWYGIEPLAAEDPSRALALALQSRIPILSRFMARRVSSNVDNLEPILAALNAAPDEAGQLLILEEMINAFQSRANLAMPKGWGAVFEKLQKSAHPGIQDKIQVLAVKFGDRRIFPYLRGVLGDRSAPAARRQHALEILLDGKDADAVPALQKLLEEPAFRSRALQGLAAFDDAGTPAAILQGFGGYSSADKIAAVASLASRPAYSLALLQAVQDGKVARTDLSAFIIRQLRTFKDDKVDALVGKVWGTARETAADKLERIRVHKEKLSPGALKSADLPAGRALFARICSQCHILFGAGAKIAPDLTGSNRANLDYILENILDPNAVVGKDYQMTLVATRDGRVVTGLILQETESAVTLRTVTEEVLVPKKNIRSRDLSTASLMPEGLIDELKPEETRDLIAYLGSPGQVYLPGTAVQIDAATHRAAGVLEGESLQVVRKGAGSTGGQDMAPFGRDKWSGNSHLWWTGGKPGDRIEIALPVERAGTYKLEAALTKARDYGIVQLDLDGKALEGPIDLYNDAVVSTGAIVLGELPLTAGEHKLGVQIVGANPKSVKVFMFGLDYILLNGVR